MISAIIPFRDWSIDRLKICVGHLRQLSPILEIILVDYGSADPAPNLPGCRVARVDADLWCLSEANNIGISEATNDVILKIDADVHLLIEPENLEAMAKRIASGEVSFFVLQPTDFQYENGVKSRMKLRPNWGEGCGNLFSRADVVEIGGFDTRYFDYGGEDNDLCQRLRRYGKRVELYQSDKVLHERHPPSVARVRGKFTDSHKKSLLADRSIFRPNPFRYSDYEGASPFGPTITVAIATTDRPNRDQHLAFCLEGLAAQTFQDFEVRICENGSPKEARLKRAALRKAFPTLDIDLHQLADPSIPKARNLLTAKSRGFYIAVHDDDDFSMPSRFEEQLEFLATQSGAHGCHSGWIEFDEETGGLKSYLGQSRDINELLRRPGKITLHGTALYRRDALARMPYDESLVLSSDHHLHIRMTLAGFQIPHTGMFHCLRRLHASSVSATGPSIQRDVSDQTNSAYRYFLGEPFLSAVRAEKAKEQWVTGFPTMREMLTYLPAEFGRFRMDLDLETAIGLGFDPIFGTADDSEERHFEGLDFAPAAQDYGYNTKLVMRSTQTLTACEALEKLVAFQGMHGVSIVSDVELGTHPRMIGIDELAVPKGHRRVISRRYQDMDQALAAIPASLLAHGLGEMQFFAVNSPADGVHVMLGAFNTVDDLEYALSIANAGTTGDYYAVSNGGKRGGFNGA